MRDVKGKSEKKPLTHNLDKEFSLVLSSRVSHGDGVAALILSLRPLNYKAAQGLPHLHADPSLALSHLLPHRAGQSERDRQNKRRLLKRTLSHDDGTAATVTGDSTFPL